MSTEGVEKKKRFGHGRRGKTRKGYIGLFPCFFVLLSGHFLFFAYAFHAAISIRYWLAIDIAIRYRCRSYSHSRSKLS
ncbi:MAG: hypothetical protein BECKG1743D_GA0114223_107643 [Candidatus Kentron sp. G]|nr:MAG: hypothetical protein BECKG1743F_GA0114225_107113 [Candidatus Kentron sp. G]VFN05761.1 MAG: hypothetical protein BECKG1743D_GA0114223_107643 [Candidatus Kentron sp. G]